MNKDNLLIKLLIIIIKFYKLAVSPYLPSSCMFYPSCSVYAMDALKKHGLFRGLMMSAMRILRCHPLSGGGYDPVP